MFTCKMKEEEAGDLTKIKSFAPRAKTKTIRKVLTPPGGPPCKKQDAT